MHLEHYEPETSSSWKGSILMFVAGTAIGAVAALLTAPASGRDSRAYLKRQSRKVATDVSEQADRLASAVNAQADRLTSAVKWGQEQATSAVRETMDSAVAQAKAAYNAALAHRTGPAHRAGDMAPLGANNTPRSMTSSHS
jgi:gas vesicle protein